MRKFFLVAKEIVYCKIFPSSCFTPFGCRDNGYIGKIKQSSEGGRKREKKILVGYLSVLVNNSSETNSLG